MSLSVPLLWQQIVSTEYRRAEFPVQHLAPHTRVIGEQLDDLDFLACTLTHSGDTMPKGREKLIHRFGSCARVVYTSRGGHPYTGLFRESSLEGVARISQAQTERPWRESSAPGLGLKFPTLGRSESLDVVAMPSLAGQQTNPDLFAHRYRTEVYHPSSFSDGASVPGCQRRPLQALVSQFYRSMKHAGIRGDARRIPLLPIARTQPNGQREETPVAPDVLEFVFVGPQGPVDDQDFRLWLSTLKPGAVSAEVRAMRGGASQVIGDLHFTGHWVASRFGDEHLFFQHRY
jgi:hypothetical protein